MLSETTLTNKRFTHELPSVSAEHSRKSRSSQSNPLDISTEHLVAVRDFTRAFFVQCYIEWHVADNDFMILSSEIHK
jgi:hypothetical protein